MSKVLSVRLPDELYNEFMEFCSDTDRKPSPVLNRMVERYLFTVKMEHEIAKINNKRFDSITKQ